MLLHAHTTSSVEVQQQPWATLHYKQHLYKHSQQNTDTDCNAYDSVTNCKQRHVGLLQHEQQATDTSLDTQCNAATRRNTLHHCTANTDTAPATTTLKLQHVV